MIKLFKYLFCIICLSALSSNAQNSDFIPTLYRSVPTLLNPAAVGSSDYLRLRAGARLETLGIHGAKKNFIGTADAPYKIKEQNIGAGLIINNASFDYFRNIIIEGQGSYRIPLKKGFLSAGISIGYFHTTFQGDKINSDSNISEGEINEELPREKVKGGSLDFGLGIRYETELLSIGISGLHLNNPKLTLSNKGNMNTDLPHVESNLPASIYFETSGNIPIKNSLFKLQPSLVLGTDFSHISSVLDLGVTWKDMVTFGLDYRWKKAAGIFAAVTIKDFFIGYSWEYQTVADKKRSSGNHELIIGYQFRLIQPKKGIYRQRSIRLM